MRFVKRALLTILSLLPFSGLSLAAESAKFDAAGKAHQDQLTQSLLKSRQLLMPQGSYSSTISDAKNRLARLTGITEPVALEQELERHLEILLNNGVLTFDENTILSAGPSWVKM